MPPRIPFDRDRLADLCRRHGVLRLFLFGSVLRDDFRPSSDVDILVEFEPDAHPGFGIGRLQDELSEFFGRKADVVTPGGLSRYIRDDILRSAEIVYSAEGMPSVAGERPRSVARRPSALRRNVVRLHHMLDAANEAAEMARNASRATLDEDRILPDALAWVITKISRLGTRISRGYRAAHPNVPWKGIIAWRRRVCPAYNKVDRDQEWAILQEELPGVIDGLRDLLAEYPEGRLPD